MEIILVIAAQ